MRSQPIFTTVSVSCLCWFAALTLPSFSNALDNGLGLTPPMGWNSWNHFYCHIDEELIRSVADALVSTGLRDLGYSYVNLDDCWQIDRNKTTGRIVEDPRAFPSGMKALGDYIHSKGLKFGLYSDAGLMTCQGRPGSLGVEIIDAQSYADFGCDYLKYDNCYSFGLPYQMRYKAMRDALNATGRPIFYSLCEWGIEDPATWAGTVGNSWRTTSDIQDDFGSVLALMDHNDPLHPYAGPGRWNDPDMLQVGNGGLTLPEERLHFTMWAMMKSPLLMGNDITTMAPETMAIFSNRKVIAINQDPLGVQAHSIWSSGADKAQQVWAGPLSGGAFVVALLNRRGTEPEDVTVHFRDIPNFPTDAGTMVLQDLWSDSNATATGSFTTSVPPHGVVAFRMSPASKVEGGMLEATG